jgi:hypothetical protein
MSEPKARVPRVVEEASKAVARDIKPALRLMGRIFVNSWLGDQSFVLDVVKEAQKRDQGRDRARPAPVHAAPDPKEVIIDAEIVSEDKNCPTCGGSRRVGRPGHEVTCPSCK